MPVEAFANNWAYLKVELNNLERLLLAAVAKQKKDQKEGDRLLRTPADRAAQHWLQGLISLEGPIGYDAPPPRRSQTKSLTYSQQLDHRIQATQQAGKWLALPTLCDRLNLTVYEKNLILLGIAPEIHRRYAKLYEYLNGGSSHLLTVDLSLRLLCRNDQEWRQARSRLKPDAPLRCYDLIDVLPNNDRPFLQQAIRLNGALVNYLLAEQTAAADVEALLAGAPESHKLPSAPETAAASELPSALDTATVAAPPLWLEVPIGLKCFSQNDFAGHLVLPQRLKSALLMIAQELKFGQQVDQDWGFVAWPGQAWLGQCVLFTGPAGTGKASAAAAIAQYAGIPLMQLDVATNPDLSVLCQQPQMQMVPLLLVRHADRWLSRQTRVNSQLLQQFFQLRQRSGCFTVFTAGPAVVVPQVWRERMARILTFAKPTMPDRAQIWQQAFPPQIQLDSAIDWEAIAKTPLNGGDIMQIARQAAILARSRSDDPTALCLTAQHIQTVIKLGR